MNERYKKDALLFKAFADDNRLEIIEILSEGEHCACDLLAKLSIGQSTLSHHMKILTESGIILARKSSKWMYYSIDDSGSLFAKEALEKLLEKKYNSLVSCECCTEDES